MKYTQDHEWIKLDGDVATVGITIHAAKQLGDIVFVELPEVDTEFTKGDDAAVVESVKAASEVYAPVSGSITQINEALEDAPETVNAAPETDGWFFKIKLSDISELGDMMNEAAYKAFIEDE